MADFKTVQSNYSPDNRLSFEQATVLAARFMDLHQVSSLRALKMVEETQAARQEVLDQRAKDSGSAPWSELRTQPGADLGLASASPTGDSGAATGAQASMDIVNKHGHPVRTYVPDRRMA